MRIALVSNSFLPDVGGAELVVHELAQAWGRQGHEVRVLNWVTDEATHPQATYSVRRYRPLRGAPRFGYHRFPFFGYTARQIARLLREFAPDFVSGHMGYPTASYLARARPRWPFMVTCHGRDLTHFDWGYRKQYGIDDLMRRDLQASLGAVAISSYAHRCLSDLGLPEEKIHDIPNGVDLERFRRPVDFDLRDVLGLPKEAMVVLSVGRVHPQKDFETGLRAFAAVARDVPRAHQLILGKRTTGLRPLVDELGLTDRVHLHEGLHGDDLVGAYQQADVFFSSSVWEMMPLVVLEAMAAGLPAVVTNVSGSQDLVRHEQTGLVVEPGAVDEMAAALRRMLTDARQREDFAASTARRADGYAWDRVARMYVDVFEGTR